MQRAILVRPELVEGRWLDRRAARFDFAQHERILARFIG
jgi:hypothetical protein